MRPFSVGARHVKGSGRHSLERIRTPPPSPGAMARDLVFARHGSLDAPLGELIRPARRIQELMLGTIHAPLGHHAPTGRPWGWGRVFWGAMDVSSTLVVEMDEGSSVRCSMCVGRTLALETRAEAISRSTGFIQNGLSGRPATVPDRDADGAPPPRRLRPRG